MVEMIDMESIDIRTLPDEVFDDFFNKHIRVYLKKNGNATENVDEYIRCKLKDGPTVCGRFSLVSRANKHKNASFLLSTFSCLVSTDDSKSDEYVRNATLTQAWQDTLSGQFVDYADLLEKYYSTDEEIKF